VGGPSDRTAIADAALRSRKRNPYGHFACISRSFRRPRREAVPRDPPDESPDEGATTGTSHHALVQTGASASAADSCAPALDETQERGSGPVRCSLARQGGAKLRRAVSSKEPAQPVRAQSGVAQDPGECSLPDFLVERHHQRVSAPRLLRPDVAAALAHNHQPSCSSARTSALPETTGCRGLTPAGRTCGELHRCRANRRPRERPPHRGPAPPRHSWWRRRCPRPGCADPEDRGHRRGSRLPRGHPGKCTEQHQRDDDAFDDARPHRGNVSRC
jgi:hypothetical protein